MKFYVIRRMIVLLLSFTIYMSPALSEVSAPQQLAPQHRKAIVYLGLGGVIVGSIVVGALLPSVFYEVLTGGLKSNSLPKIIKIAANKNGIGVISGVMGNITGLGVVFMGAPIWEPLQANIKRKTFKFIEGSENQALSAGVSLTASDFSRELDKQWKDMQSHFSMNGQWNRDVYVHMLIGLEHSLQRVEALTLEGESQRALEMLALILYRQQTVFPEIPFSQNLVTATARVTFPSACQLLSAAGKRKLVNLVSSLPGQASSFDYDQVVKAWFACE